MDPEISISVHNEILCEISRKSDEIWRYICKVSKSSLNWWAFSNDQPLDEDYPDDGSTGGDFDPVLYAENIEIIGQWSYFDNCFKNGFPTSLLWTKNWKEIICKDILENKSSYTDNNVLNKASKRKIEKQNLINSIKYKLTSEELKVIKFV